MKRKGKQGLRRWDVPSLSLLSVAKLGRREGPEESGRLGLASLSCVKTRPLTNDWYSRGLGGTLPQPVPQQPPPTVCLLGRGGMIQTCEQYQFVHHVMSLYEKQLSRRSPE